MSSIQAQSPRFKLFKRSVLTATALFLAFSLSMLVPYKASVASPGPVTPSKTTNESVQQLDAEITSYKGEIVKLRTQQLATKRKGLERAMKTYALRGQTPKWEESMILQRVSKNKDTKLAHAKSGPLAYPAAQDTFSQGDIEISFITYSGNMDAWSGIVYVHSSSQDDTYSGDFLTPSDDGTGWAMTNEVYYPPDGGNPTCNNEQVCPQQQISKTTPVHKQKLGKTKTRTLANHGVTPGKPGIFGWLSRWWGCVTNGCGWAGFSCSGGNAFSRFFCRIGFCVAVAFGCI